MREHRRHPLGPPEAVAGIEQRVEMLRGKVCAESTVFHLFLLQLPSLHSDWQDQDTSTIKQTELNKNPSPPSLSRSFLENKSIV